MKRGDHNLCVAELRPEIEQILRDLNSWWDQDAAVRPAPPPYRRRSVPVVLKAISRPKSLIQVLRGPRQVGKTTALYQLVDDLLRAKVSPLGILCTSIVSTPTREIADHPLRRSTLWSRRPTVP